jgi:hypothetical protein
MSDRLITYGGQPLRQGAYRKLLDSGLEPVFSQYLEFLTTFWEYIQESPKPTESSDLLSPEVAGSTAQLALMMAMVETSLGMLSVLITGGMLPIEQALAPFPASDADPVETLAILLQSIQESASTVAGMDDWLTLHWSRYEHVMQYNQQGSG